MKKHHILVLLVAFLSLNIGAQTIKHNKQVKLKVVKELTTPAVDSKVLVLDPVNDIIKYVDAENLPGDGSGGGVLESVDEGNGAGYRNSDIIPENRGNIGQRAYDFGFGSVASTTFGPTGFAAIDFGEDNIVGGYGGFSLGNNNQSNETYIFMHGNGHRSNGTGGWNFITGLNNTINNGANTAMNFVSGANNTGSQAFGITGGTSNTNNTVAGLAVGIALTTHPTHGAAFLGTANAPVIAGGFNSTDGASLIIGNGTTSSGGASGVWNPLVQSNNFELYRNGVLLLPSTDISNIVHPKHVITKEYADANYSGGGSGTVSKEMVLRNAFGALASNVLPGLQIRYATVGVTQFQLRTSSANFDIIDVSSRYEINSTQGQEYIATRTLSNAWISFYTASTLTPTEGSTQELWFTYSGSTYYIYCTVGSGNNNNVISVEKF